MSALPIDHTPLPRDASRPPTPPRLLVEVRAEIEALLDGALPSSEESTLAHAMRHAVLGGGKRIRPLLCLLSHQAAGGQREGDQLARRLAVSLELVHCASLVHDDLPAFDDADTRRGRPTCHRVFGEPMAILVGDALLSLAFEHLSGAEEPDLARAARLVGLLGRAVGATSGIIGGQAMELGDRVDLGAYHRQKTAALFAAAAEGGALCAGAETARFRRFGELVGLALQLRDDLDDATASGASLGKPAGQDERHGRPNAALLSGVAFTAARLQAVLTEADALLVGDGEAPAALRAVLRLLAP